MKVLVVGGAGYIGIEACLKLREEHVVWALDPSPDRTMFLFRNKVKCIASKVLEKCLEGPLSAFDVIINLTGGLDDANLSGSVDQQALSTKYLRDAAPKARLVHVSTMYVYSTSDMNKERSKPNPIMDYGFAHLMAEQPLLNDDNAVILRFGTVWGESTFTRYDTWGNHFFKHIEDKSVEVLYPKSMICLLSMHNAIKSIVWALDSPAGIYNVADKIGFREDLAKEIVGDVPMTVRKHTSRISIGMDTSRIQKVGFSFDD